MPREVSVRTSGPPEWKGGVRPDVVGLRDLDMEHVLDIPDAVTLNSNPQALDDYLQTLDASEGPSDARKQMDTHHIARARVAGFREPNGG